MPDNRQFLGSLLGGISAGLAASVVRVPTEVLKQRMQTGAAALLVWKPAVCNMCVCMSRVVRSRDDVSLLACSCPEP